MQQSVYQVQNKSQYKQESLIWVHMICLYAYMQMWYYVSSTYADPGIFAKGGGGGEVRGSRQKKAPLPGKKTLASYFLFLVLISNFLTVLQRGVVRFFCLI